MNVSSQNLDIKSENELRAETDSLENQPNCPDEKLNSDDLPATLKLEKVIVSKIKEERKNEFIVRTYKNVNAGPFVDPLKPIEVIDIKIKEEIRDGLSRIPNSSYIKSTPRFKKRKPITEYKCSTCGHRTFSKGSLARHKEQMHTKKEEECKPPLSSFQASFEEHIKQRKIPHGPKLTKIFKCSLCSFQTESHYQFSKHTLQHNRAHSCTSCNFTSSTYCELNQHSLKHQNEEPSKPNIKAESIGHSQCTECSYETFNESFIKEHVTTHKEPVKWAECPHCPYKTSYKHGLRFHSRLHEDQDEEQKSPKHEDLDYTNEYRPIKTEFLESQRKKEKTKKITTGSKSRDLLRNLLLGPSKYLEGK